MEELAHHDFFHLTAHVRRVILATSAKVSHILVTISIPSVTKPIIQAVMIYLFQFMMNV